MIPLLQNDYYKYNQMFRGNYLKGATLLRSLLNDPNTREPLLESLPALSAIFTDFSKCEATRLCYNVLSDTAYFDIAVMNYLKGIEATTYSSVDELIHDGQNVVDIIGDEQLYPIFRDSEDLLHRCLEQKCSFDLLRLDENSKPAMQEDVLTELSNIQTRTTTNLYTSYNTYYSNINGDVCDFDANETYYSSSPIYELAFLDDVNMQVFLPTQIRTRVGSTSTYYYYPGVFKYDIATDEWELLRVSDTAVKNTSNYKTAKGVAYDSKRDNLYLFYRADSGTQMCCDIIRVSTGSVLTSGLSVGNVGSSSYMNTYYCYYDTYYDLARFVWDTNSMNSTNTTYGWLYGCSVNQGGLVWSGIAAIPTKEVSAYYSSRMQAVSYGYRARCPKGAFVGCFANSSSNTSACTMAFIVPSGTKMVSKYISLPSSTDYADFYSANNSRITENGLFFYYGSSVEYSGSSNNVILVIDIPRGKLVKTYLSGSTSYTYTLYVSPTLNKVAFKTSKEDSPYTYVGIDGDGNLVEHTCNGLHSLFTTEYMTPCDTDMYKLYAYNSSNFNLYKYGGFTE